MLIFHCISEEIFTWPTKLIWFTSRIKLARSLVLFLLMSKWKPARDQFRLLQSGSGSGTFFAVTGMDPHWSFLFTAFSFCHQHLKWLQKPFLFPVLISKIFYYYLSLSSLQAKGDGGSQSLVLAMKPSSMDTRLMEKLKIWHNISTLHHHNAMSTLSIVRA